ncbi:unnamed protein product, partial [Mesorhabditis belari]|uniref:S1 motif domain-containing protein n=1 Tax=Mesorhabditis belari TaxID=2138241 RepID=A0AAF3EG98_9BILA
MTQSSSCDVSFVDWSVGDLVAEQCGLDRDQARRVCKLFDEGCEVPFVARYRVTQTGHMTCEEVRKSFEAYKNAKELEKKVTKAITQIRSKTEGDELRKAIEALNQARDSSEILSVTKQFAEKKTTKAGVAKELGLEPAAIEIFNGKSLNLMRFVDKKDLKDLKTIEGHLSNLLAHIINKQTKTTEVVQKISHLETKARIFVQGQLSAKAKKAVNGDGLYEQIANFQSYINFSAGVLQIHNHQILALERGEERGVLTWSLKIDNPLQEHPLRFWKVHQNHVQLFQNALNDSVTRLFEPRLQRAVRRFLVQRAERAAIECFARNLRQLFAQSPLIGYHIIALDPGYKMCKLAFLSPLGEVIDTFETPFRGGEFTKECLQRIGEWCHRVHGKQTAIAIGNGAASKETQQAVARFIKEKRGSGLRFCVVPENGASKYSVTPLAEEELPKLPPTLRSAVSIGRRLLDPMGEYVKIEPQHLGLGMYQHSVSEKRLAEALRESVREAVSLRGVNVNKASVQLLQQVCGLNKTTAAGIVSLRKKEPIGSREALRKVKGLGEKAFEQCAGFLIIDQKDLSDGNRGEDEGNGEEPVKKRKKIEKSMKSGETDPLDATMVHPSQYEMAKRLLNLANVEASEILMKDAKDTLKRLTNLSEDEQVVRDLMLAEQELTPPPPLQKEIRSIGSLQVGETFWGRVQNNTDFGTFVDVGAERDGLIFGTKDSPPPIGSMLRVTISGVDLQRGRVQLRIPKN